METTAILLILAALVLGAVAGWFFGSRPVADLRERLAAREGDARELDDKFRKAIVELEGASVRAEKADVLAEQLETVRVDREGLRADLATLKADAANHDKQITLMKEAREELLIQFRAAGSEVLGKAQEKFIADAAERFGNSERANKEAVANLLKPVNDRLLKYEEQVGSLERQRTDAFAKLNQQIETMRLGQEEVRREAQRLGNSLTNAPKARGRWGERALQNLLEQCGLAEHTDFHLEQSMDTDEGRMRPDAIVNVPGQKKLVIDSKVSLNAYQAAFEADDDDERARHMALHAKSMRNHVQTLGAKSYQSQFEEAPDYVVMFVPGEHFVAAALEADPTLWDYAFDNRVLLATPTNLVAIARTVAQVWRQDALASEAQEIGRMGAELYSRLETAASHLKRVGGGLETAVNNYNKFVGSFERNVLSSARRMQEKGIEIGKKEIDEVPLVESAPRYTSADVSGDEKTLLSSGD
ncbi:DNA recombination protein RmuC [Aurantiacibacter marinus]|uniref:DNA recombination protein RmuC homolog n=1 Tax=Aurantiacibacter marinus TaxID=874156 RepID=A0A0H0XSY0_9SPHN|nr:DNA recombination protein RmuC [Aurantiacibacter marinus]KLI63385.1 DNA recombinase [Aurantiacibacter marinus]